MDDFGSDNDCDLEEMLSILSASQSVENETPKISAKQKSPPPVAQQPNKETETNGMDEAAQMELELKKMEAKMEEMRRALEAKKQAASQPSKPKPCLKEVDMDLFSPKVPSPKKNIPSIIHKGDTDSSDDEDNRNPLEPNYNEFGKFVKRRLAHTPSPSAFEKSVQRIQQTASWKKNSANKSALNKTSEQGDCYNEPFSGIRICNPKLSSQLMKARMEGRRMVQMFTLKTNRNVSDADWVTIGTIVFKAPPKVSQKGKTYSLWRLSDLRDCSFTVTLFLFGDSHKDHWKIPVGTIVGLLNPKFMGDSCDNGPSSDVTLSLDNPQKLMEIGTAKDLGWCKGKRRDGQTCGSFVNMGSCEYCIYHLKSEYKKLGSKRMELQGVNVAAGKKGKAKGKGSLRERMAAELPLGTIASRPNSRQIEKDRNRLSSLGLQQKADSLLKQVKTEVKRDSLANSSQTFQDQLKMPTIGSRNLLQSMKKTDDKVEPQQARTMSVSAKEVLHMHSNMLKDLKKERKSSENLSQPLFGKGFDNGGQVDLDVTPVAKRTTIDRAKYKALQVLKSKGASLEREDPNATGSKKRKRTDSETPTPENDREAELKRTFLSNDFRKLLETRSSHQDLVENREQSALEQHLENLEKKEAIEAKMASTFEVPTKAVCCLKCRYRAFSATERCRKEQHPLKVFNTVKRFFRCHDCGSRTVALDRLPKHSCQQCGGSLWEKAPMFQERKCPLLDSEKLSLCGDDGKLLDSVPSSGSTAD